MRVLAGSAGCPVAKVAARNKYSIDVDIFFAAQAGYFSRFHRVPNGKSTRIAPTPEKDIFGLAKDWAWGSHGQGPVYTMDSRGGFGVKNWSNRASGTLRVWANTPMQARSQAAQDGTSACLVGPGVSVASHCPHGPSHRSRARGFA